MKNNIIIIIIFILIAVIPASAGKVYQWVDKNGVNHFSDKPPSGHDYETGTVGLDVQTPALGDIPPVKNHGRTLKIDIYKDFKYMDEGWPYGLSVGQTMAVGMFDKPSEQLKREPLYIYPQVLYGYLQMGNSEDNRITFAIDGLGTPEGKLYVDKNNNEDLTDDGPPYTNQGSGKFASLISLQLDIITMQGKKTNQPYQVWLWIKDGNLKKKIPYYYARCYYIGRIMMDGQQYIAVAFEKDRHDGLYRENGICVDLNKDNKCSSTEHFFHNDIVAVGDRKYQIVLDYP